MYMAHTLRESLELLISNRYDCIFKTFSYGLLKLAFIVQFGYVALYRF